MSLLLLIFTSDILPIFVVAGAGFLLAKYTSTSAKALTHVVFYALLPCLVFRLLVTSAAEGRDFGRLILLAVLIIFAMGIVGYIFAILAGLNGVDFRAFLLVVMFSNAGNYGLPVVRFAFGPEALTYGTIFFLTGSVMMYTVGGFIAAGARHNYRKALIKVAQMPNLYGLACALIVLALGKPVPDAIMRPITLLSDAALPLMIMVLGMQLERTGRPARPGIVALAAGVSLVIAPLAALGLTALLGISGVARQASVTLSATPVAIVTSILAVEFEVAPDFVTSAIFLSTLLSPFTLTPLIAYLK